MKKKIFSLILALTLVLSTLAFAGCSEIESGSKVQRMVMTLNFYDASGEVVDTKDVQIKLYINFAPETTAAFMKLCEQGFYDGVCIYNVQNNFLEFGRYKIGDDGKMVETDAYKNAATIKGEFSKNGFTGNKLVSQRASLIMKRDYDDKETSDKKYDTAKGSIILALNNTDTFTADKYCVFGTVCNDDEENNPSVSYEDSSKINRTGMNSYAICNSIKSLREDKDGTVTYYYDPKTVKDDAKFEPGYYTKAVDDNEEVQYYRGTEVSEENLIDGDDKTAFIELINNDTGYVYVLPYTKVVITKIVKKA